MCSRRPALVLIAPLIWEAYMAKKNTERKWDMMRIVISADAPLHQPLCPPYLVTTNPLAGALDCVAAFHCHNVKSIGVDSTLCQSFGGPPAALRVARMENGGRCRIT